MGTGGGAVVGVRLRRRRGYCNLFVKIRIVSSSKKNKDKKKTYQRLETNASRALIAVVVLAVRRRDGGGL